MFLFQVVKKTCWLTSWRSAAIHSGLWLLRHTETCMAGYDRSTLYFPYFCLQCSRSVLLSGQSLESKTWWTTGWHQQTGTQFPSPYYHSITTSEVFKMSFIQQNFYHTIREKKKKKDMQSIAHSVPLMTEQDFLERLNSSSSVGET